MAARRRFSGEFKVKVALEALRGDKTIQEIATRCEAWATALEAVLGAGR